jgi:hypothetical protein
MKTTPSSRSIKSHRTMTLLAASAAILLPFQSLSAPPAGKGGGQDNSGAERIPLCVTFANDVHDRIQSSPQTNPVYCDGTDKVRATVGGNVHPDQIVLNTNDTRKKGGGRELYLDFSGYSVKPVNGSEKGSIEVEFASEWGLNLQGMQVGEIMEIGAKFVWPSGKDKNHWNLTFGDTAPDHTEPSCEHVPDSGVWIQALSLGADGRVDNWLVWADETRTACLIQFINWEPQPPILVTAPFAMLVTKQ